MASKICSRCTNAFTCHANSNGCWCEEYQLSAESLNKLKSNFSDCLCPDCLRIYQIVNTQKESNKNNTTN